MDQALLTDSRYTGGPSARKERILRGQEEQPRLISTTVGRKTIIKREGMEEIVVLQKSALVKIEGCKPTQLDLLDD